MWFFRKKKETSAEGKAPRKSRKERKAERARREAELAEALEGYRAEMEELYENRRRRSIERANMTEEELIASMCADYEAVYQDAAENGMSILLVGDDEDKSEAEGEGEEDGE